MRSEGPDSALAVGPFCRISALDLVLEFEDFEQEAHDQRVIPRVGCVRLLREYTPEELMPRRVRWIVSTPDEARWTLWDADVGQPAHQCPLLRSRRS